MADDERRETRGAQRTKEAERPDERRTRDEETRDQGGRSGPDGQGEACCDIEVKDPGNRDIDYERAQRDAGGDYTTSETGGIPVGERVPVEYSIPGDMPGDEWDDIPTQDRTRSGTVDDIPYSLGENRDDAYKPPLEPLASGDEETDLWEQQKPLIDEDRETGYEVFGFSPDQVERIAEAIGEDAAEEAQGTSVEAEGSRYEVAHGGFPERTPEGENRPPGQDEQTTTGAGPYAPDRPASGEEEERD